MRLVIRCTAISLAVAGPFVLFVLWYWGGDDFKAADLPGTYVLHNKSMYSTLTLRPDQTFLEEIDADGQVRRAQGRWTMVGESVLSFSSEFLTLPGQAGDPGGVSNADLAKRFGVISINLRPSSRKLAFQRKLLQR